MFAAQVDVKELEKERRIEEALKRIEQLNVRRSDSPEVRRMIVLPLECVTYKPEVGKDTF